MLYGLLDTENRQPPPKKRSHFPSSSSPEKNIEYANLGEKMGDTHTQHHHHHQATSSRLGLRSAVGGGEIVEVQGGHIVRSIGRKDRHSKVCTAKGPRDRRVRLSAHTAIQFYDVQDRLGYDRPSKAVDWLIKKAKAAIDELEELPAWNPLTVSTANANNIEEDEAQKQEMEENQRQQQELQIQQQQQMQMRRNPSENNSSFMPPSMDSDSIADTIKSFFPMGGGVAAETSSSAAMQFQSFPPPDLLSRTCSQSQDLRLSLQSFQDPILLHHHHQQQQQQPPQHHQSSPTTHQTEQALFSGNTQLGFDPSGGWSEHQPAEMGRFQRMFAWNSGGDTGNSGGGGGGFAFNSPPTPPLLQPLLGQHQFFSQRGPLQSSYTPSVRAWIDPSSLSTADHHNHHHHHHHLHQSIPLHPIQSSISGIGFASGVGGFSGFRIPARIQGEEEEYDGISDKPSSASSDSRH